MIVPMKKVSLIIREKQKGRNPEKASQIRNCSH